MLIDKNQSTAYVKLNSVDTPQGTLSAWYCQQIDNPVWDAFLNSTAYGHFYQTSMWAQVRILDGWRPFIVIIRLNENLVGGFQILTRSKSHLGKIGIVLKGPVITSDDPTAIHFVVSTLKETARTNCIRALIVQPPDRDRNMPIILKQSDFSDNHIDYIIRNNTVVIDLHGTENEIFRKIKRQKRQNINTAIKNNILIREGQKDDLRTFFNFMIETCKRQQVSPSPSNIDFLYRMWDLFAAKGHMKLFLAQFKGTDVSALIVLPFSNTAYMWKFGWSGNYGHCRPNEMLYWEIFKWAKNNGCHYADVDAISPEVANTSLHGGIPSDNLTKSYSRFKNEFGGEVLSLSRGFVYIPNPMIRCGYNLLMPHINSLPSLKKRILFGDA